MSHKRISNISTAFFSYFSAFFTELYEEIHSRLVLQHKSDKLTCSTGIVEGRGWLKVSSKKSIYIAHRC